MTKVVLTGAGRGLGRGIAQALIAADFQVVGLSRTESDLKSLGLSDYVVGDVTDGNLAEKVLAEHRPDVLVLSAGAIPAMAPIHEQTWDTFNRNWQTDTRHVFEWLGAALRQPLAPGSTVVVISSGAALRGSPLSGGYAAAKGGVRFITSYAAGESASLGLGLRFVTLFPQLTPLGAVGASGAEAYAARSGESVAAYLESMQPVLTPEVLGQAVLDAITGNGPDHVELLVTGSGARPVP